MAKHKSKSHHEDSMDDEPHADQAAVDPQDVGSAAAGAMADKLTGVTRQLQYAASHNAAVSPDVINALYAIADELRHGAAPTMPVIDSLEPATAPEGTVVLVVSGQNFSAESVICYGDVNQNTQVKSDLTQLTATFESGAPGSYVVLVHDPAGDSNELMFDVT